MFEPIMVFAECFCHDVQQKIDKPFVKKIVNMMDKWERVRNSQELVNTILVVKGGATSIAKKVSTSCYNKLINDQCVEGMGPFVIEPFSQEELLVNVTKHELVPKHQILKEHEKAELLKKYRVKDAQLPKIQCEDPISRYFGAKRGDVVRIVRPSETAGRYVTYRVAV